ncbi:MAG TPA: hypothetical protein VF787_08180 [Thermoanaerobaculia bacterium]
MERIVMFDAAWKDVLPYVADHLLIAAGLSILFAFILLLGTLHTFRLFVRFLVGAVQEAKRELGETGTWLGRLKHELTTWKADE